MPQKTADPGVYRSMGLTDAEFDSIRQTLGRDPSYTELGMFAVLWSEHCSYKSSKPVLKLFSAYRESTEGEGLENAGVIDIGDGIGIVFKVESHNHPSAVEPYQGAATGVGGIIRDILTMGARPIASLNSLRFGPLDNPTDRRLFDGVVRGIGGYGNCIGVPTVAGEVSFHPRYAGSPLVNAMCIGRLDTSKIATARAEGVGNPVLYLGSATGRDGIHGATFASEVLDEDSEAKRPNVQIGDPFAGKLLIEATMEALDTGAVVAIQDMGAAGLTCSTCEMSAKGGVGMDVLLDKVPLRDETMNSYEIMLSETQERMLAVVQDGREQEVVEIFHKWGLPAVVIGHVTADPRVIVRHRGAVEARIPAEFITEGCPTLDLAADEPENLKSARQFSPSDVPIPAKLGDALTALLSNPTLASKRWVYEQYDTAVQTQTALGPGKSDAAVLFLRGTEGPKGIATKIDGNGHWVYADPYVGGMLALVEAARNVACTGAIPRGATDCLNFGDPTDPQVFWQFREAVRGVADAAEALNIPVLSGNVSFYNETELGEVLPTPTIGVVGVLDDASKRLPMGFPKGRGFVYLIHGYGKEVRQDGLGASEYLRVVHGIEDGAPQPPDLTTEKGIFELLALASSESLVECAHDVSEGGLAFALAEMCISGEAGCYALVEAEEHYQKHVLGPMLERMSSDAGVLSDAVMEAVLDAGMQNDPWGFTQRTDARLFGEMPGRVLVGVSSERVADGSIDKLWRHARERGLFLHCVGSYDSSFGSFQVVAPSRPVFRISLSDMRDAYEHAIPSVMEG